MKRQHAGPDGVTPIQLVVILAIAAVLAGILLPSVSTPIRKGQTDQVVTDLNLLRASATAFFSEITRYPGDVDDLANQITASDTDVRATTYPVRLITRWAGPYLDRKVADGDSLPTGFGGVIRDDFTVDQISDGVHYLTIRVDGLSATEFTHLDKTLDDGNGAAAGRLRMTATGDTMKYLAVPLQ